MGRRGCKENVVARKVAVAHAMGVVSRARSVVSAGLVRGGREDRRRNRTGGEVRGGHRVDLLAVAIGTTRLFRAPTSRTIASPDRAASEDPLVMHGGSSVPDVRCAKRFSSASQDQHRPTLVAFYNSIIETVTKWSRSSEADRRQRPQVRYPAAPPAARR
jgi:hypothetical protein